MSTETLERPASIPNDELEIPVHIAWSLADFRPMCGTTDYLGVRMMGKPTCAECIAIAARRP